MTARGYNFPNTPCQKLEYIVMCSTRFGDSDWIEENCYACIRRSQLNDAGNRSGTQLLNCIEDFIQRLFGRIVESVANAHDQRGVSEGRNLHARKNATRPTD
jgi:predicted ATP-grasp superfamily ATP-dependent carboligase